MWSRLWRLGAPRAEKYVDLVSRQLATHGLPRDMYTAQEQGAEVARHQKRARELQELEQQVVQLRHQNNALVRREIARAGFVGTLPALPPLPDSVFVHIGQFMGPRDLVSLSLASRRFHSGSSPFAFQGGFKDPLHQREIVCGFELPPPSDSDDDMDPPQTWSIANESARLQLQDLPEYTQSWIGGVVAPAQRWQLFDLEYCTYKSWIHALYLVDLLLKPCRFVEVGPGVQVTEDGGLPPVPCPPSPYLSFHQQSMIGFYYAARAAMAVGTTVWGHVSLGRAFLRSARTGSPMQIGRHYAEFTLLELENQHGTDMMALDINIGILKGSCCLPTGWADVSHLPPPNQSCGRNGGTMLHVWDGRCTDGRWGDNFDDDWRVFDWPGCPGRGRDGSIKAGDVLGLLLNYDEGGSQMSVYLNGTRCGVMLRLEDGLWDEFTPFYWAVDVTGGCGVRIDSKPPPLVPEGVRQQEMEAMQAFLAANPNTRYAEWA